MNTADNVNDTDRTKRISQVRAETILIHPETYRKDKRELDKTGYHIITANYIPRGKRVVWKDNGMRLR